MDDVPVGRRVAYWRARRKLTQQLFADRLGKSKSWVDKIERGVRRLDRYSVIYQIADVLRLDVQVLMGRDPVRRPDRINCVDQIDVAEIRKALELYDTISAIFTQPGRSHSLGELAKSIDHGWLTFLHSRYGVLSRMLPRLIREARAASTAHTGVDGPRAARLLGQTYQLASATLRKVGEHDLAWLAADRALMVSHQAKDDLLTGLAVVHVADALTALGRFRSALELSVNAAVHIAPDVGSDSDVGPELDREPGLAPPREATPQRLSVYGTMLLRGAVAAARLGDASTVGDLFTGAEEAAKQLGRDDNHYWTSFGTTNVALHRVATLVELGEGEAAMRAHATIDPIDFAALMPERRAHHMLNICRAHAQTDDIGRAGEALVEADRVAPSEVRCRPIAHELLADIVRRTRGAVPDPVAALVEDLGLVL